MPATKERVGNPLKAVDVGPKFAGHGCYAGEQNRH
jgi:hypothetical protein